MSKDLEHVLDEVAGGAARRSAPLPVEELRRRGVRRRRARQAGLSAMGVAAAFGVALGAAQLLPDGATPVEPALPSVDATLPLGACGSDARNIPAVDGPLGISQTPARLVAAPGRDPGLTLDLENFGGTDHLWGERDVVTLLVVRDAVVVGWSWHQGELSPLPPDGVLELSDFGPVVVCPQGALAPEGEPTTAAPLPPGEYRTVAAILTPGAEVAPGLWIYPGPEGHLTMLAEGEDPGPDLDDADEATHLDLPACGEPLEGFEPPARLARQGMGLEVAAVHTGADADGARTVFRDGYGDQLALRLVLEAADVTRATVLGGGAVVAHEGTVVARVGLGGDLGLLRGDDDSLTLEEVHDWVDCATEEHTQVPKGEYEVLAWLTVAWGDEGTPLTRTYLTGPVPFTAYDYGDPDNPGPAQG